MSNWTHDYDRKGETKRLISSHALKRCPLCGAVNAVTNEECFVCRWRGEFDTRPEEIEQGMNLLFERCPELALAVLDKSSSEAKRWTWMSRLGDLLATFMHRHRII